MSKEFKPGDLALMVPNGRSVQIVECLGCIKKLDFAGHSLANYRNEPVYMVEFLSGPMRSVFGDLHSIAPLQAHRLMPLEGDEEPAQMRQAERVQ